MGKIKVLQINVDRRGAAQDLSLQTAASLRVDIILVSEPNRSALKRSTWYGDLQGNACIIRKNPGLRINDWGRGAGYVWVKTGNVYIYSVYISPNCSIESYQSFLQDLQESMSQQGDLVMIGGDFNAKSPLWGSPREDARGKILAEWMCSINLIVANVGEVPTFERGNSTSHIDVTMTTELFSNSINEWRVLDEESLSLHRYISFEVLSEGGGRKRVWSKRGLLKDRFAESIKKNRVLTARGMDLERYMRELGKEHDRARSKFRTDYHGNGVYWWTEQIEEQRRRTLRARRAMSRIRGNNNSLEEARERYRSERKTTKKMIEKEKARCWDKLCTELENDIWGEGYKIIKNSLKPKEPRVDMPNSKKIAIAEVLFPEHSRIEWEQSLVATEIEELTIGELGKAAERLKPGKAPGPDGVTPEAVKILVRENGEAVRDLLNRLLKECSFPVSWKEARLILIPKPGRDVADENGYRPICLLDTMAKLYEAIIVGRLEANIKRSAPLSDRQFGFRKGKSAIGAVQEVIKIIKQAGENKWRALILLDVKNAFNTANWKCIVNNLKRGGVSSSLVRVICDYLSNRSLKISGDYTKEINIGVPQGSVLGPTLWNILYDGVLGLDMPRDTALIAYADDLAAVVVDDSERGLVQKSNEVMARINAWMKEQGLTLAPQKTEVVVFCGMRRRREGGFNLEGVEIEAKATAKYLGITVDRHLAFGYHIENVCVKAERVASALSRLLPNIKGPNSSKRRVIASAIESILLYGAPVWVKGLSMTKYKQRMGSVQRKMALRVASAYRTVSSTAVLAIAGMVPIHLAALERKRVYESEGDKDASKIRERERTIGIWQVEYESSGNGEWTRRLIKNIGAWIRRSHGCVNYFLTQFLTGHGSFGAYLKKIKKKQNDECIFCEAQDTPEHAVFECPRSETARTMAEREVGASLTPDNVVELSLRNKRSWKCIMGMVEGIIKMREEGMRSME